ncbi:MAG: hypothetical protein R6V55_14275 [Desulfovermiculus sp.]
MNIKNVNLNVKLIAITVLPVVLAAGILWTVASKTLEQAIYSEKEQKTEELVEVGLSTVYYQ